MPITNTLDVSRRLIQAGVPAPQAEVFSDLFEGTAQDPVRDMRVIVTQEGERTRAEIRAELRDELRKQMLWFFTVQTALLGLAVAVIKLFP
jgi:hypothetical protein